MPEILKQTSTQIVIGDSKSFQSKLRDRLLSGLIVSSVIAGFTFFASSQPASSGALRTLMCDRVEPTQVNCTLTMRDNQGVVTTTSIAQLQGAKFSYEDGEDGEGDEYYDCEVKLLNREGSHSIPLQQFSYRSYVKDCNAARTIEAQINQLVNTPSVKFSTYQEDTRTSPTLPWLIASIAGGSFFFMVLLIGIGFLRRETWEFDRSKKSLVWQRQSIFGTQQKTYPFHEIKTLTLSLWKDSDDDRWGKVEILMRSNRPKEKKLDLLPSQIGGSYQTKCREISEAIHAATDLPLKIEETGMA